MLCAQHYGEAERMLEATTVRSTMIGDATVWFVSGLFVGTFVTFVGMSIISARRRIPAAANAARAGLPRCAESTCAWFGAHYEPRGGHEHEYAQ